MLFLISYNLVYGPFLKKSIVDISMHNKYDDDIGIKVIYTNRPNMLDMAIYHNQTLEDIKQMSITTNQSLNISSYILAFHYPYMNKIYITFDNAIIKPLFPLSTFSLYADIEYDKIDDKEREEIILRQLAYGNVV